MLVNPSSISGTGFLAHAAYLGGKLVYDVGVGVEPAHGVYRSDAPKLKSGQIGSFVKTVGTDLVHGVQHMVQEVAKGRLVPRSWPRFVSSYRFPRRPRSERRRERINRVDRRPSLASESRFMPNQNPDMRSAVETLAGFIISSKL